MDERLKKQKRSIRRALLPEAFLLLGTLFSFLTMMLLSESYGWGTVLGILLYGGIASYFGYFAVRLLWVYFGYFGASSEETEMVSFDCRKVFVITKPSYARYSKRPWPVVGVVFIAKDGKRYFYALVNELDKTVYKVAVKQSCEGRRISLKLYKGSKAAQKVYVGALADL